MHNVSNIMGNRLTIVIYQTKRFLPVILVFALLFLTENVTAQADGAYKVRRVVIDPGHGGRDPGAVGRHSREKDIVLAISLKLGGYINQYLPDVEVIYTRSTDEYIELHRRAEIANKNNADLFISIHANANTNRTVRGTDSFVMGLGSSRNNLEIAMKENAVILMEENYDENYQGFDPNSPESYIIFSLMQNTFLDHSLSFASHVQSQFRDRAGRIDRGVRQAGFMVLFQTAMPSALIEVGFISNEEEERFLMSEQGQSYIASAIFRAFRDYKNSIDRRGDALTASGSTQTRNNGGSASGSNGTTTVGTATVGSGIGGTATAGSSIEGGESSSGAATAVSSGVEAGSSSNQQSTLGSSEIFFRVQIVASGARMALNSEFFSGIEVDEFEAGGVFKYVTGRTVKLEEIVDLRNKLTSRFSGAFIVAEQNGTIISLQEALGNN